MGRCFIKNGEVGDARFWYESASLLDGQFVEKPSEFLAWASQIYRNTKKLLGRYTMIRSGHQYTYWCGKVAQRELESGHVRLR